ncbi:MAG: hypothetical protein RL885_00660 [Planctomycetota bacterium]
MNDSHLEQLLRGLESAQPSAEFQERLRDASRTVYRNGFSSPWRRVPWWVWAAALLFLTLAVLALWHPWETFGPST